MSGHSPASLAYGPQLQENALGEDGTVRFRLWAPSVDSVALEIEGQEPQSMKSEAGGWFLATARAKAGSRYRFRLPDGLAVPDPASRRQAGDVHDASIVVDPNAYRWQHPEWRGRPWHEAVVYELHPGAFGGFAGIERRLPELAALGVTAIELMPIADFPGKHNWGYDGVLPYAPDAAYGTPEELKSLVDAAHGLGLMILLDVVYNHFGPDGAYLHVYAKAFFDEGKHTPWGAAIDFNRPDVGSFFIENALMWLNEYRFDGLRFDAVHAISPPEFLDAMAASIRCSVAPGRHVHLVLEHEGNVASHLARGKFDAQWTDDVHHCLHVLLTGESEGYYEDFQDAARLLARALAEGFAYQGEVSPHSGKPRGTRSVDLPTTAFVICLQNHDQIGNRALGERLTTLADPQALRAATSLLLLVPFIPMLFMGEEFASRRPFLFFTDHNPELAELVRRGRRAEFKKFAAFSDPAKRERIPDPNAAQTFAASVPEFDQPRTPEGAAALTLYRALLAVRFRAVVPRIPGARSAGAQALSRTAVHARWTMGDGALLTVAANFGPEAVKGEECPGSLLFESEDGAGKAARHGRLPARATVAFLQESPP
ncbi:MAG: malto-oligosyltrehalose trehalohydrolase [Acidisphaera sp.]|nr:malto-oligosyltrehalose trehalohydrolase [Acidisphaera sp.]